MSLQRIQIQEGVDLKAGTTYSWRYSADHTQVVFHVQTAQPVSPLNNKQWSVPDIVIPGDWIGKTISMYFDGVNTAFLGELAVPKDPRRKLMWDYGFKRNDMVLIGELKAYHTWADVVNARCGYNPSSNYGCDANGRFMLADNVQKVQIIRDGYLMVASAYGTIVGTDTVCRLAYIDPNATIDDMVRWENQYTATM